MLLHGGPLLPDDSAASSVAPVIAYLLLGDPLSDSDRAALFTRARGLLPVLTECGPWDGLRDIVFSARRYALNATTPPTVRNAALSLVSALGERDAADRLVRSAHHLGQIPPELATLLQTAGAQALWSIAWQLKSEPQSASAPSLASLAHGLGADAWHRALMESSSHSAEEALSILPLIAGLPTVAARLTARRLSEYPDARVRQRALAFLFSLVPYDPVTLEMVKSALRDADAVVADIARAAVLRLEPTDMALIDLALDEAVASPAQGMLKQQLEDRRRTPASVADLPVT
ncbi:MAG: hypothetical protein U0V87_10680 [Acidobacteriota bacterium]